MTTKTKKNDKILVVLVGPRGVDKTGYCERNLKDHEVISIAQLGTMEAFSELCWLIEEKVPKIVIDGQNPTIRSRTEFLHYAKNHGYKTRIIEFEAYDNYNECFEELLRRGETNYRDMSDSLTIFFEIVESPKDTEADFIDSISVFDDK